eukprot:CAMPEP_0181292018 /NCGR_PEP_ID=MMETSP1101-20121128/2279_1 /TAXON_ID=46948 /ORGANISM="Rhodomonas abbreviata, Strain Caron Lab Isolate" /LENGTH=345 /DNA_ID=CAMNT_0023396453 /DNA_START=38 /DNA_END=1075 /DNA_ORIENTATION=-
MGKKKAKLGKIKGQQQSSQSNRVKGSAGSPFLRKAPPRLAGSPFLRHEKAGINKGESPSLRQSCSTRLNTLTRLRRIPLLNLEQLDTTKDIAHAGFLFPPQNPKELEPLSSIRVGSFRAAESTLKELEPLSASRIEAFRAAENTLKEALHQFQDVSGLWQRRFKGLTGMILANAYANLSELESLVKSQISYLAGEANTKIVQMSVSQAEDKAAIVLCESLLFTIPFQLQKLQGEMERAYHSRRATTDWERVSRALTRFLEILAEHFSSRHTTSLGPLPALHKRTPAEALDEVYQMDVPRAIEHEASYLLHLQRSETFTKQPRGWARVRRAPFRRIGNRLSGNYDA